MTFHSYSGSDTAALSLYLFESRLPGIRFQKESFSCVHVRDFERRGKRHSTLSACHIDFFFVCPFACSGNGLGYCCIEFLKLARWVMEKESL